MMKVYIISILFFLPFCSSAQNNAIFFGGSGDGVQLSNYVQPSNTVLYLGATDDGSSFANYVQLSNELMFTGDSNDGVALSRYAQISNMVLFNGGDNDGVQSMGFEQSGNSTMFSGGLGDGWANVLVALTPLPLELLSFVGNKSDDSHLLQWSTAQEDQVSHFELEWSANARDFKKIGTVASKGNGNNTYELVYKEFKGGFNFYRLKMVDLDGSNTYSNIIEIYEDASIGQVIIYPNPASNILHIQYKSSGENRLRAQILNNSGQVVKQTTSNANETLSIDIADMPQGVYVLQVLSNHKIISQQFIKL